MLIQMHRAAYLGPDETLTKPCLAQHGISDSGRHVGKIHALFTCTQLVIPPTGALNIASLLPAEMLATTDD